MMTGTPHVPSQADFMRFDPEAAAMDTLPAAMEEGDVVLPAPIALANPELKAAIAQAIYGAGGDPNQYIAGSAYGNFNPYTGQQHFGFLSKAWKSVKKTVKKIANDPILRTVALSVIAPGVGTALGGSLGVTSAAGTAALGYGATSAGLTLAGGGDLKDAAVSGVTSAGGAYLGSMASTSNALEGTAGLKPGDGGMFSQTAADFNANGLTSGGLNSWSASATPQGFGSGLIQGAKDLTSSVMGAIPESAANYLGNIDLTTAQYAGYGDTAGAVVNAVRNMPDYLEDGDMANFQYAPAQLPTAQVANYLPANQLVNQNNSPSATPYQGVGSIIQNALNSAKDTGVSYLSPIKNRDSGEEEYGDFGNRFSGTYRNARRGGFGGAMLVL